ncbi:MAG: aldehyde ferredoxin oxidoreductase family protein [Deltaproteobacteria bacterium]|nr:aldehyde ferredoxin oxidoreductase family protein [Deltaproteobacteria bacterium]
MSKGMGYHGKILRVDLTSGKITVEEPGDEIYRRYMGGGGLASYFMLREMKPGVDPLGPENMLIFMTSIIGSGQLSGTNRYSAVAKSPLTGGYGEAEAGGYWGPELKAAGYDGIIITGQSAKPVYLFVSPEAVELRDASKYWGKTSGVVSDGIKEEVGDKRARILQTGISGENLVRFAALVNELKHFHGRGGLGAVMGSKKLKAIACLGSGPRMKPVDKDLSKQVFDWFRKTYVKEKDPMHLYGSARGVATLHKEGILPTENFRHGHYDGYADITGQKMAETILVSRGTCYSCSIACKREVKVEELGVEPRFGGPEYETISACGSLLRIHDLKKIAKSNQMLGEYVLDTISTGVVIAFAMECFEKGILTTKDTDGLELNWGNVESVHKLIEMIATRQGIGDLLAEGTKRAAEKLGRGSEIFAMHVKGQELPMHEPRGKKSLALAYATSPTGADHMEAPHDPFYTAFHPNTTMMPEMGILEGAPATELSARKAKLFYKAQRVWSMYNTVGMCDFVGAPINAVSMTKIVEHIRAVTGWDVSLYEVIKAGERADAMSRVFNVREGFTPSDDTLPPRLFDALDGPLKGERVDPKEFEQALATYYQMAGWDPQTGMPTPSRLMELDLEWTAQKPR